MSNGNAWLRVNRARRCPICDHADWCLVARDGTVSSYEPFPLTRDYLDPALQKILS